MKTSDILKLKVEEFEKELSPRNHEYIIEIYKSTVRALVCYQEDADINGESEYLEINEYFDINRKNDKEYEEYLKELFEI